MNKRQAKKQFKKKYKVSPTRAGEIYAKLLDAAQEMANCIVKVFDSIDWDKLKQKINSIELNPLELEQLKKGGLNE